MNQKTMLVKPDITSLITKDKTNYLYYVENSLHVYDLKNDKVIQRLPNTRFSLIAISNDGSLLVCVHPVRTNVEIIIYHIDGLLLEERRVIIHTPFSEFAPMVSNCNQYIYYCGDDSTIWRVTISSAESKCIFRCKGEEIIKSISINHQDILISVFGIGEKQNDSYVLLLDFDGKMIKKFDFVLKDLNNIRLRNIGCNWISDSSFVCFLSINFGGQIRTSLQTVSLNSFGLINVDYEQFSLCFDFYPHITCVSDNQKFIALGGIESENFHFMKKVIVYSLPKFEEVFTEHYDYLWSLHFANSSLTLIICSNMQHFIDLS